MKEWCRERYSGGSGAEMQTCRAICGRGGKERWAELRGCVAGSAPPADTGSWWEAAGGEEPAGLARRPGGGMGRRRTEGL